MKSAYISKWSLLFKIFSEEKEKVACEEPPFIENGTANVHSTVYYNGDKVTYRCDRGFRLRGSNEITCNRGKWTPPPECVGKCTTDNINTQITL